MKILIKIIYFIFNNFIIIFKHIVNFIELVVINNTIKVKHMNNLVIKHTNFKVKQTNFMVKHIKLSKVKHIKLSKVKHIKLFKVKHIKLFKVKHIKLFKVIKLLLFMVNKLEHKRLIIMYTQGGIKLKVNRLRYKKLVIKHIQLMVGIKLFMVDKLRYKFRSVIIHTHIMVDMIIKHIKLMVINIILVILKHNIIVKLMFPKVGHIMYVKYIELLIKYKMEQLKHMIMVKHKMAEQFLTKDIAMCIMLLAIDKFKVEYKWIMVKLNLNSLFLNCLLEFIIFIRLKVNKQLSFGTFKEFE